MIYIYISWLVKVRKYLHKIEKGHPKTKQKKLASRSRNSHLKRLVIERFDEHLPHIQFKLVCPSYCNSPCQEFEHLYTPVTINKTSKYPKGESAFSQTCQDDINLSEVLTEVKESNDSLDSTGNLLHKPMITWT